MRLLAVLALMMPLRAQDSAVELARSAPPEIFASTVLTLVERGALPAKDGAEQAFAAAARARNATRFEAVAGVAPDPRAYVRARASNLGLDTLSLQARALKISIRADPAQARKLFASVEHAAPAPKNCDEPLVPDDSAYYEMAGMIAQSGFSEDEQHDEKHVEFLQNILAGTHSPRELSAFAQAVSSVTLDGAEKNILTAELAAKLEAAPPDYREFTQSAGVLREALEKLGLREPLTSALRRYLTAQMSAARCDENFGGGLAAVEWFNGRFGEILPPIRHDEVEPSQRSSTFVADSYFLSPMASADARNLWEAFERLRGIPGEGPRSEADRSTAEWRAMLGDFERSFWAWTPAGSEIDVFHQRVIILKGLLEIV